MKLIYTAANIAEAHIVSGLLDAHGIDNHVGGFYLQGGVGELATMDFASIHVADSDADSARSVIADYESGRLADPPSERID